MSATRHCPAVISVAVCVLLTCSLLVPVLACAQPSAVDGPSPATADSAPAQTSDATLAARESAAIGTAGSWSVGVFNPVQWAISDKLAIRVHPWPVLRPVQLDVRVAHMTGAWSITGEYGLELQGLGNFGAMPLGVKGDLVPSCKVAAYEPDRANSCKAPGFSLAPRAAIVASTGRSDVLTVRADFAVGIALGEKGQPLDALPNLDLAWAAVHNGWRGRLGARYDLALTTRIRWASEANAWMVAPETAQGTATARSPLTLSAWTGFDFAVGDASRFTIGVIYYNSDQRRTEMVSKGSYWVREALRNHDLFPTIDFIWAG